MTKRYYFQIAVFIAGVYFALNSHEEKAAHKPVTAPAKEVKRSVASVPAQKVSAPIPVNKPSPEWKSKLEDSIRQQADVKDLQIEKVDSFIWKEQGLPLHVESAIVTLKNEQNTEIRFRVLVDSQNGKVLRTWDHPVFDPMNPKDKLRIEAEPVFQ